LPVAILEAWAYELPVLMTPECNLPEGFDAGASIRISSDPDCIVEGLRTLFNLKDAEMYRIGCSGRNLVDEQFSWSRVAGQMHSVYSWLLGRGAKPSFVHET